MTKGREPHAQTQSCSTTTWSWLLRSRCSVPYRGTEHWSTPLLHLCSSLLKTSGADARFCLITLSPELLAGNPGLRPCDH